MRRPISYSTRLGLFAGAVVVLVLASAAAKPVGEESWFYGVGEQHFDYGDQRGELDRVVEAWIAADGRYRVTVVSAEGSAEEFTYDGSRTLMFVAPPGQKEPSSIMELESPNIFAVEGFPALVGEPAAKGIPTQERRDDRSSLPTYIYKDGINGASYEMNMKWRSIGADPSLLELSEGASELLSGYVFETVEEEPVEDVSIRAVNSNSATFWDSLYTEGPCVYAKNYRDAEDSFLAAYSSKRGDCAQVAVSLFHGSQLAYGSCQPWGTLATGTGPSGYVYRETYSAWSTPTCTAHAAWWDGLMVVPWDGLSTIPWAD